MFGYLLLYTAALAAAAAAILFGIDRLIKVGTKGTDADISLNSIFFTGLTLTLAFMALTVAAFTGALALVKWLTGALAAGFISVYVWRRFTAGRDKGLMDDLLALEEARVRETARLDPANAAAWQRLSELRAQRGDYPEALQCLRKVCELEPTERNAALLKALKERAVAALRANGGD